MRSTNAGSNTVIKKAGVKKSAVKKASTKNKFIGNKKPRIKKSATKKHSAKTLNADQRLVMTTLRDEHAYIGSLRKALQVEINKLNRKGLPDYLILRDMMSYLMAYPDVRHHPLEDRLFARLLKNHSPVRSDIIELLAEHKDLAKESQYLYHLLDDIVLHRKKPKKALLRMQLTDFMEMYGQHIKLEESVAFPAAEKTLQAEDWQRVASSMEIYQDPLFESNGEHGDGTYESLRIRVNDRFGETVSNVAMVEMLGFYSMLESYDALSEGSSEMLTLAKRQFKNTLRKNWQVMSQVEDSDSLLRTNVKLFGYGLRESSRIIGQTARACAQPYRDHYKTLRSRG